MSAALELQKALTVRLKTGAYNVYNNVPKSATLPYIQVGADTLEVDDTFSTEGFNATVTIHTWSAKPASKEVKTMQGAVYALLHRYDLAITGYNVLGISQIFENSFLDPDGITHHGVQQFRVQFDNS